jgi:hypothetical protein
MRLVWLAASICRRRPDGKWRRQLAGSKVYATIGWTMFAVGNALRFISMRFAAQTVLSGLGSLQFVVIPIASRGLLGIQPQLSTAIGVGIVLFGNFLILAYGPPENTFTLTELRYQWITPQMKAFLVALLLALGALHLTWRLIHRRRRIAEAAQRSAALASRQRKREIKSSLGGGGEDDPLLWGPAGASPTAEGDVLSTHFEDPNTLRMFVAALLFSAVSSFIGAWSVLFSKSLTYVVTAAPASARDPYSWFTIAAFLGTAVYWIRQSNKGLKLYPATLIMPLMQAFWMAMSILEGMIYFDEMRTLSSLALTMLASGLILAVIGAVAMGLAGFINEKPQLLAVPPPPSSVRTGSMDVEAPGSASALPSGGATKGVFGTSANIALTSSVMDGAGGGGGVGTRSSSSSGGGGGGGSTMTTRQYMHDEAEARVDTSSSTTTTTRNADGLVHRDKSGGTMGGSGSLGNALAREVSLVAQRRQGWRGAAAWGEHATAAVNEDGRGGYEKNHHGHLNGSVE